MAQCNKCGGNIKTIPAGVSKKTGRPYNEFSVCEVCSTPHKENGGNKSSEALQIINDNILALHKKIDKLLPKE